MPRAEYVGALDYAAVRELFATRDVAQHEYPDAGFL
ncbi:hypothetical protein ENSA5_02890 [Enhygromyxa salina]|uniref:Uncharacterized protein n=1 Tax=Enhygromyxa salina TaxID=215803 RepID=A0A2S9YJM0_9BACT|nr:hypothetical protein ENSA5_02890 [Enhygromyxa salina]